MLPRLAVLDFERDLLDDSGFKGASFATASLEHDIHVSARPAARATIASCRTGLGGSSSGLFACLSRCCRLNIVYDRAADFFVRHVWIAMISIIARRLVAQTQTQTQTQQRF